LDASAAEQSALAAARSHCAAHGMFFDNPYLNVLEDSIQLQPQSSTIMILS
jgi:hypothetical protein